MSKYIAEHSLSPAEAMNKGLSAGAGSIKIDSNNGVIEVKHSDGSVLMQARNVRAGTMNDIWAILETCGDIDYRARG